MNGLDLFSGIGGITKALEGYVQPVAYCENDRYAAAVLLSRMASGDLPLAPIWDDVRTLYGSLLPRPIDVIYGGFPCQDLSCAGRGAGLAGERSGLFSEIVRLVSEIRPRFVFLENVPAIRTRGGDVVAARLAGLGYDCRWDVLSASDVGANHRRERWWLLAHANGESVRNKPGRISGAIREDPTLVANDGAQGVVANTAGVRRPETADGKRSAEGIGERREILAYPSRAKARRRSEKVNTGEPDAADGFGIGCQDVAHDDGLGRQGQTLHHDELRPAQRGWWAAEPDVGRVANGIPNRVDRLRALGNAVVPAQARAAFERLMGL